MHQPSCIHTKVTRIVLKSILKSVDIIFVFLPFFLYLLTFESDFLFSFLSFAKYYFFFLLG